MSNVGSVLGSPGRLETAGTERADLLGGRFSLRAVREWAGICLWAVFCLACGCAGVLAVLIR